jgi:hypothetical protein
MRLLSLKDLEGHDPTGWAFDDLLVVSGLAAEIYEAEKYTKQWKPPVASPKRSAKRPKMDVPAVPNPPPDLPEEFQQRIKAVGGTVVVMVIQKRLTDTDLQEGHNRLSMPFGKIDRGFLREEEKYLLARQQIMEVPFMEPSREVSQMILRQWDMSKESGRTSFMYVLRTNWKAVAKKNVLKANDVVQVWSFRVGGEQQLLGLALVVVGRAPNLDRNGRNNEGASSSQAVEDLKGKKISSGGSMDFSLAVTEVAAVKYEEEKSKESESSSKQERLIKEKALKKPLAEPVGSPNLKQGFDGEKLMASAVQAQRRQNRLKRSQNKPT